MNIIFWSLLLLMLLIAIAVLVYPLLRVRETDNLVYTDSNLSIHDDKMNELALDLEEGRIDRTHYKNAIDELNRELLTDVPAESADTAAEHYSKKAVRQPAMAIVIAVFVPLVAFLVYLELGMHAASTDEFLAEMAQPAQNQQMSVQQMTEKLLAHIKEDGGSAKDWTMLGRSYKYMKQYDESSRAFAEAVELDPANAFLLLERAEIIALMNDRQFVPEARELVLKAQKMAPDDYNALWFAGVAEFQAGNYQQSMKHLKRLATTEAAADEDVKQSIISYLLQARKKLIAQGKMAEDEPIEELEALLAIKPASQTELVASAEAAAAVAREDMPAASGQAEPGAPGAVLRVRVEISDDVKQRFNGSADVFVYAKAKNGPKFPLAVQRMKLAEFPTTVTLDDSMEMIAGMNLSAFGNVVVSARVTTSGSAISQAGDYIGSTEVADVSTADSVNVQVSERIN